MTTITTQTGATINLRSGWITRGTETLGQVVWTRSTAIPAAMVGKVPEGTTRVISAVVRNRSGYVALDDATAAIYDAEVEARQARAKERADRIAAIPGLAELRAALDEHDRYDAAFARMMESERNDGAQATRRPTSDIEALRQQYPVAALYLRAESYTTASDDRKAEAGRRAIEAILAGDLEAARDALDNWLPLPYID